MDQDLRSSGSEKEGDTKSSWVGGNCWGGAGGVVRQESYAESIRTLNRWLFSLSLEVDLVCCCNDKHLHKDL